jgi:hypothetical protein
MGEPSVWELCNSGNLHIIVIDGQVRLVNLVRLQMDNHHQPDE